jgi:hypothetical protein
MVVYSTGLSVASIINELITYPSPPLLPYRKDIDLHNIFDIGSID